jgi:hypothetical protein
MSAPGQVANSLRAWAKWWDGRGEKRLGERMVRAAEVIADAAGRPIRTRPIKTMRKVASTMIEERARVSEWMQVKGGSETSSALFRAYICLIDLAEETEKALASKGRA